MTIWFTSDPHYGHDNIRRFCDRPFANVWEMNECLIRNYNSVVKQNDKVFFCGDFALKISTGKVIEILKRLNGKKYFLAGNHDKALFSRDQDFNIIIKPEIKYYVEWIKDYYELHVQDQSQKHNKTMIVLSHYANRVWNKSHHGSIMLYGHSHGGLPDDKMSLSMDVGVDSIAKLLSDDGKILRQEDYRPISYEEIINIMSNKKDALNR